MKRGFKCLSVFIIGFIILSAFPVISSAYSEQYPDYLDNRYCAYITCKTNLGNGTLVLPINTKDNAITITKTQCFFNMTNSTINGYFILPNGTKTTIRGTYLSNLQYAVNTGYNTTYADLHYTEIVDTNLHFSMNELEDFNDNSNIIIDTNTMIICIFISVFFVAWLIVELFEFIDRRKCK